MGDGQFEIFDFNGNEVRTVNFNGDIFFVGKDVADILGYERPSDAIALHVDEEDKQTLTYKGFGKSELASLWGRNDFANKVVISESGMYSLVLRSKMEEARAFKRWVTKDVLPTIRKHGAYLTDSKIEEALSDPDMIIKLATQLKEERSRAKELETKNKELNVKASYVDGVLASDTLLSTTEIAKDFGMSATKLNKILGTAGVQFKRGNKWTIKASYQSKGYTKMFTYPVNNENQAHTINKWTHKGYQFIVELMKDLGHEVNN